MNIKHFTLILSVAIMALASGCKDNTQTSTTLRTEGDTASFYLGYFNGMQFEGVDFELNMDALIAGINSGLQKMDPPADPNMMNQYINTYAGKRGEIKIEKIKQEGIDFLAANAKKSGVITTESGLQYKIEKEGTGIIPADTNVVKVHYKGTFIDGKEFDSSIKHGTEPIQFRANQVISGWTEALTMMPVGSKWILYIPSDLAYGTRGNQNIPPHSVLIFEVELVDIEE